MKLFDGGIVFFIVVGVVATVIGSHSLETDRREQEYRHLSGCIDRAVTEEDRKLCAKLFSTKWSKL